MPRRKSPNRWRSWTSSSTITVRRGKGKGEKFWTMCHDMNTQQERSSTKGRNWRNSTHLEWGTCFSGASAGITWQQADKRMTQDSRVHGNLQSLLFRAVARVDTWVFLEKRIGGYLAQQNSFRQKQKTRVTRFLLLKANLITDLREEDENVGIKTCIQYLHECKSARMPRVCSWVRGFL